VIKYDPHVERGTFQPWWVIIQCDRELLKYYQHIFYKLYWKKLQTAMWGAHISVVRGEKPTVEGSWKKLNGRTIEFSYEYEGGFYTNGQHFWIKAWSPEFNEIRKSLGLSDSPRIPYHLSIGTLSS
jgi:hypothetical protein